VKFTGRSAAGPTSSAGCAFLFYYSLINITLISLFGVRGQGNWARGGEKDEGMGFTGCGKFEVGCWGWTRLGCLGVIGEHETGFG
jgi:hypothetical protein